MRSTSAPASGSSTPRPTRSSRSRRTRRRCRSRSCTRPAGRPARLLTGEHAVGRVIARPFEGEPGAYRRTANRHDFSLEPPRPNYLTRIREAGGRVAGVGKIGDVFAGCDIDESQPTHSNAEGLATTVALAREAAEGLVFVNLVETDHDLRPPQRSRGLPPLPAGDRRRDPRPARARSVRTTCWCSPRITAATRRRPRRIIRGSTRCWSRTSPVARQPGGTTASSPTWARQLRRGSARRRETACPELRSALESWFPNERGVRTSRTVLRSGGRALWWLPRASWGARPPDLRRPCARSKSRASTGASRG